MRKSIMEMTNRCENNCQLIEPLANGMCYGPKCKSREPDIKDANFIVWENYVDERWRPTPYKFKDVIATDILAGRFPSPIVITGGTLDLTVREE